MTITTNTTTIDNDLQGVSPLDKPYLPTVAKHVQLWFTRHFKQAKTSQFVNFHDMNKVLVKENLVLMQAVQGRYGVKIISQDKTKDVWLFHRYYPSLESDGVRFLPKRCTQYVISVIDLNQLKAVAGEHYPTLLADIKLLHFHNSDWDTLKRLIERFDNLLKKQQITQHSLSSFTADLNSSQFNDGKPKQYDNWYQLVTDFEMIRELNSSLN